MASTFISMNAFFSRILELHPNHLQSDTVYIYCRSSALLFHDLHTSSTIEDALQLSIKANEFEVLQRKTLQILKNENR